LGLKRIFIEKCEHRMNVPEPPIKGTGEDPIPQKGVQGEENFGAPEARTVLLQEDKLVRSSEKLG